MGLDIAKLYAVKPGPNGTLIAQCPACAKNGRDIKSANHLIIYPNGAYGCAAHQGDNEHTKAIWSLAGDGSINTDQSNQVLTEPIETIETFYDESLLDKLVKKHDYFIGRGITEETLNYFRGGVALSVGKLKNRYVLPLYNEHGKIHGFTGRYIYPIPEDSDIAKWKHIGSRNKFTWPYYFNWKSIIEAKYVILVESPGCVLKLWDCGIKNVLCIFGTVLNSALIKILISLGVTIIIATNNEPDNNNIGNKAAKAIKKNLEVYFDSDHVQIHLPPKKDFLDCSCEEIYEYKTKLEDKIWASQTHSD